MPLYACFMHWNAGVFTSELPRKLNEWFTKVIPLLLNIKHVYCFVYFSTEREREKEWGRWRQYLLFSASFRLYHCIINIISRICGNLPISVFFTNKKPFHSYYFWCINFLHLSHWHNKYNIIVTFTLYNVAETLIMLRKSFCLFFSQHLSAEKKEV